MAEPRHERRRRVLRRAGRVAAWVLGVLVLLVVVAGLAARAYLTEARVRTLAENLLDEALQGRFALGAVDWSPFPLGVTVRDLTIHAPDGEQVLAAGRLHAAVDPWPLLRREIHVTDVDVSQVQARLVQDATGEFGLMQALQPAGPPSEPSEEPGWSVSVRDIDVADVEVLVRTVASELTVNGASLDDAEFALDPDGLAFTAEGLTVERLVAALGERTFEARALAARDLSWEAPEAEAGSSAAVGAFGGRMGRSSLRARGRVDGLGGSGPSPMEASGEGRVDLEDAWLLGLLPPEAREALAPTGQARVAFQAGGTLQAPDVALQIVGEGVRAAGMDFQEVRLQGALEGRTVELATLELATAEGRLTASGRMALAGASPEWSGRVEATEVPIRRLGGAFVDPANLPERLSGTVEAEGKGLDPPVGNVVFDLRTRGRPSALPPSVPGDLRARGRVRLAAAAARLDDVVVTGGGARLAASGAVPLDPKGRMDLEVEASHDAPGPALAAAGAPVQAASARIEARLSGTLSSPRAEGRVEVSGLRAPDVPPFELAAPFRFDGGALTLEDAVARGAGGRVGLSGALVLLDEAGRVLAQPRADAHLSVIGLQLEGFTDGAARGRVFFEGRVGGTPDALAGQGEARIQALQVGEAAFSEARAALRIRDGRVEVEELVLAPEAGGTLGGRAVLTLEPLTVDGRIEGRGLSLSGLAAAAGTTLPVEGAVLFDARVTGPLDAPTYAAAVNVARLRADEHALGALQAHVRGDLEVLHFWTSFAGRVGEVRADGTYALGTRAVSARLDLDDVRLARLPGLEPTEDGEPAVFAGRLHGALDVAGTLPVPDVNGTLRIDAPALHGAPLERPMTFRFAPLEGTLPGLGLDADLAGLAAVDARLLAGEPLSAELEATFADLDLTTFLPFLQDYDTQIRTTGVVEAVWQGGEDTVANTHAEIRLAELTVDLAEGALAAPEPVSLRWQGGELVIDSLRLAGPRGDLSVAGRAGDTLDLTAQGELQMGLVALVAPPIARASGTARIDLTVNGTPQDPEPRGTIRLATPVSLRPRTMVREVVLQSGGIVFEPDRIRLERLTGDADGGLFTAEGAVDLEGLSPQTFSLSLSGQNLPFRAENLLMEVNADLEVAGRGLEGKVAGRIDIVEGRYLQKFELRNFNFVAQRREVEEPLARRFPWLGGIELDLRATSSGGMEVAVDAGAFRTELNLDTDVRVTGTAVDPVVDGRVSVERGNIVFPRATLDVTQGVIEFVPQAGEGIRPVVDLLAEGEVVPAPTGLETSQQTWFVTLSLEGGLSELVLDLASDPAMDRLEILSLLVTGKVNPLEGTAGGGDAKADAALAFAGSQLAEPLTRFVAQGLEETLNLSLQLGAEVSTEAVTVTAGKQIAPRLRLEGAYQRSFAESQTIGTVRARLLLSDQVFLEGSTESVAGTGLTVGAPREGSNTRLELKYRIFGD